MAAASPPPPPTETPTDYARLLAIGLILALFAGIVSLRALVAFSTKNTAELDSLTNLLVGFVSAIFLYLGIRVGAGK